jgi:predicted HicB family RNase H-like nuclease
MKPEIAPTIEYKGYIASLEYSQEEKSYMGDLLGTKHMLYFTGATLEEAQKNFHDLLDDYLDYCKELGKEPEPPPTKFTLNATPDSYAIAKQGAAQNGIEMHEYVDQALHAYAYK